MYSLSREDAAEILGVSTRSIDRYIKSGKISTEKQGRKLMLSDDDVENIKTWGKSKQKIIMPDEVFNSEKKDDKKEDNEYIETKEIEIKDENISTSLDMIYFDMKQEIKTKDMKIAELSYKLWKLEEVAKNSISISDHKKNQFLLEESKAETQSQLNEAKNLYKRFESAYRDEKNANMILIIISIALFVMLIALWYDKI